LRVILFQGARELMTNAARHAKARQCEVSLTFEPDGLLVSVTDDGIGFSVHPGCEAGPRRDGEGFGLFSLRSRIGLFGGSLRFSVPPEGGTRATLYLPLLSQAKGQDAA
jgi:signal transduction histidine kinase